jgi:hypothetical protein
MIDSFQGGAAAADGAPTIAELAAPNKGITDVPPAFVDRTSGNVVYPFLPEEVP